MKKNENGKLLIATFSPLLGVVVKAASRICVQKLYNITHPGYSYIFLSPVYCGGAVLRADLGTLQAIAWNNSRRCRSHWKKYYGFDWSHLSYVVEEKVRSLGKFSYSSSWETNGWYRYHGFLFLYQFIYVSEEAFGNLFLSFAIHTAVSLAIEWVFKRPWL